MSLSDFEVGKLLGEGAYSQVLYGKEKATGNEFALKMVQKALLVRERKTESAKREKEALNRMKDNSHVVRLERTFQDSAFLYFVFELLPNGTLSDKFETLDLQSIKRVLAQILLVIADLHRHGIIHRDLKPNNFMFDDKNRIKVIDFGTAKLFDVDKKAHLVRASFVGNIDYIAPEIVDDLPQTPAVDLWAFGCLIFHFFEKQTPFYAPTRMATYERIQKNRYKMSDKIPPDAQDLISKILILKASDRLGYDEENQDYQSIRLHPFFSGIDWETVLDEPCF